MTKKLVRNIVEVQINVAGKTFTERGQVLAENTEEGREWAKGFVAQDYEMQYSSPDYKARVTSAKIVKATFETTECWQG